MAGVRAIVPHLKVPIRITSAGADTVEQDSLEDIAQCTQMVCRTPQGARYDLPDFGVPDQLFTESGVDEVELEEAILEWEPRATLIIEEHPDLFDELIRNVQIRVRGEEDSG